MELDWVVGWAGLWVQSFRFVMGWVEEIGSTGNSALTRDTEARRPDACRPRLGDRGHIPDYYIHNECVSSQYCQLRSAGLVLQYQRVTQ